MTTEIAAPEAAEQSPEERQERVDLCFAINERIKESIGEGRRALWDLGEALYEFDQQHGWSALGYENQTDWLAQPEIGLTRTYYFRLIRRHKEMVLHRKVELERLTALEPSKLDIVLPYIEEGKVRTKTALNDVEALSASDLRHKYIKPSQPRQMEPPPEPPEGGAEEDDFDEEQPETIDGTATAIEENGALTAEEQTELKALAHAAGQVESWLEIGGDRRKAQRGWQKLFDDHPAFVAFDTVGACVEGGENAPDRDVGFKAWLTLRDSLHLAVENGEE